MELSIEGTSTFTLEIVTDTTFGGRVPTFPSSVEIGELCYSTIYVSLLYSLPQAQTQIRIRINTTRKVEAPGLVYKIGRIIRRHRIYLFIPPEIHQFCQEFINFAFNCVVYVSRLLYYV